jgi:hypothetical protein
VPVVVGAVERVEVPVVVGAVERVEVPVVVGAVERVEVPGRVAVQTKWRAVGHAAIHACAKQENEPLLLPHWHRPRRATVLPWDCRQQGADYHPHSRQ